MKPSQVLTYIYGHQSVSDQTEYGITKQLNSIYRFLFLCRKNELNLTFSISEKKNLTPLWILFEKVWNLFLIPVLDIIRIIKLLNIYIFLKLKRNFDFWNSVLDLPIILIVTFYQHLFFSFNIQFPPLFLNWFNMNKNCEECILKCNVNFLIHFVQCEHSCWIGTNLFDKKTEKKWKNYTSLWISNNTCRIINNLFINFILQSELYRTVYVYTQVGFCHFVIYSFHWTFLHI